MSTGPNAESLSPEQEPEGDLLDALMHEAVDLSKPEETPPETPPAEPPPPETPPAETPPETPPAESQTPWRDKFMERTKRDLSKYQTDEAAIEGLNNALGMLGQRDQDAQLGRMFREQPGAVYQYLQQTNPQLFHPPAAPEKPAEQPKPQDDIDWEALETGESQIIQKTDQETGRTYYAPAPGAPADIVQRWQKAQRAVQKRVLDLVRNGQQQRSSAPPDEEKLRQQVRQWTQEDLQTTQAAQRDQVFTQQYFQQNSAFLFDEFGQPTSNGRQLLQEAVAFQQRYPGMSNEDALKHATNAWNATRPAQQALPVTAPTPPAASQRKPDVAPPPAKPSPDPDDVSEALARELGFSKNQMHQLNELMAQGLP